ncbi:MAG TPA: zf-HC2 domain-containing protein [Thermoanaerobaculia bacterium]|nr:zf-HC2 domain-containing protein [Thermoanaerobaculia bacterium]
MGCDDLRRVAHFYLDGQLGEGKCSDLLRHLEQCKECDDRVVILKRLRLFVRCRLNRLTAPDRLRQRIQSAVNGRIPLSGSL